MKLKRKLIIPILILMIMPVVILMMLSFYSMKNQRVVVFEERAQELMNTVSFFLEQGNDSFYTKQHLLTYLSSVDQMNVFLYEKDELVYKNLQGDALDEVELFNEDVESDDYIFKKRTYQDEDIVIVMVLDKHKLYRDLVKESSPFFLLVLIAVLVSLEVLLFIIDSYAKPITFLLEGYNSIVRGDLNQNLRIERDDEFGLLGHAFNDMKEQILYQNKQYHQIRQLNEDILRNMSTGILTSDMNGMMMTCNQEAVEFIQDLAWKDDQEYSLLKRLVWQIHETIQQKQGTSRIYKFYNQEREFRFIEMTTFMMTDEQHETMGVLSNIRDVSERKKVEENAERINRLASLGEVAAALAHEIRNPISGIKMGAQILKMRLKKEMKFSEIEMMDATIKESERLDLLVTDLLNYAKPKTSRIERINVKELLDRSLMLLSEKAREKNITIELEYQCSEEVAYFDKNQLSQVFLNILTNAIHAMEQKGLLVISMGCVVRNEKKYLFVDFKDNGIGISEENLEKVFNPFFTTSKDGSGTGLGMSVVHELVIANNGDIEIASDVGIGTCVKVYIPEWEENHAK